MTHFRQISPRSLSDDETRLVSGGGECDAYNDLVSDLEKKAGPDVARRIIAMFDESARLKHETPCQLGQEFADMKVGS